MNYGRNVLKLPRVVGVTAPEIETQSACLKSWACGSRKRSTSPATGWRVCSSVRHSRGISTTTTPAPDNRNGSAGQRQGAIAENRTDRGGMDFAITVIFAGMINYFFVPLHEELASQPLSPLSSSSPATPTAQAGATAQTGTLRHGFRRNTLALGCLHARRRRPLARSPPHPWRWL